MQIEMLAIGNELLNGDTQETNSRDFAAYLEESGLTLRTVRTIPDSEAAIVSTLKQMVLSAEIIVTSGGLGPTDDDRTAESVAKFAGVPLILDRPSLERMKRRFDGFGVRFSENNEKQAWIPEGALAFENPVGSAPGFVLEYQRSLIFSLPGVPQEFRQLAQNDVVPRIVSRLRGPQIRVRRILRSFGAPESHLAERLQRIVSPGPLRIEYQAISPEILVKVVGEGTDRETLEKDVDHVVEQITASAGEWIYGEGPESLPSLVGKRLLERNRSVATAESCTGGLIAHYLTNTPGSSAYFPLGVIAYANEQKVARLDIDETLLQEHGAVSEATVRQMAASVRQKGGTDYGLATSGIAGPGGGSEEKPVGTVHIALASSSEVIHRAYQFQGNREKIKLLTAFAALDLLWRTL